MSEYTVARSAELDPGDRLVVQLEGREIGVFNVDGQYYAHSNWCPHQSGPVCEGSLTGTIEESFDRDSLERELSYSREGEILSCPWHGWEYDVTSGDCYSREEIRLPSYPVEEREGDLVLTV